MPRSTATGGTIGTVVAIQNFGAGDLIELKPASRRRDRARALHPRDSVPEIDVEGGRLTLVPPEDLLE